MRNRRRTPLLERHAGRATATVLAVAAYLSLAVQPIALPPPAATPEEPPPIVIDLAPPPPEPQPPPHHPPQQEPEGIAATRTTDEAEAGQEAPAEPQADATKALEATAEVPGLDAEAEPPQVMVAIPEAPSLAQWVPSAQQEARLHQMKADATRNAERVQEQFRTLQARVQKREVESKGREFAIASDGGLEGIVRTANFSSVGDDSLARAVLQRRYGIVFEYRNVTPAAGRSFLNAAKSKDETFVSSAAAGFFEVMSMPPKAISMMAALESEALLARGFDPSTTRIREIEFSLVPDGGDWRLAVTNLVAEPLRSPIPELEVPRGE
jgi:hypothetical protein